MISISYFKDKSGYTEELDITPNEERKSRITWREGWRQVILDEMWRPISPIDAENSNNYSIQFQSKRLINEVDSLYSDGISQES